MIAFDDDAALEILRNCGADGLAVYVALESLEGKKGATIDMIAELCGFTRERALEACQRVGMYSLGLKIDPPVAVLHRVHSS